MRIELPAGAAVSPVPVPCGQRVVVGDAIEGMASMAAASVGVAVTSPPYNIGLRYRSHPDDMPHAVYLAWLGRAGAAVRRVLAPAGSLFVVLGSTSLRPWLADDAARAFGAGMVLQNRAAWIKAISLPSGSHGHYKPVKSRRFLNNVVETVYHFTVAGDVPIDRLAVGVPFQDKSNIARRGHAADRRCAGNAWFIPYETVCSRAQKHHHPAGFPVALAERCILLHGDPACLVLDPFAGTGSTLVAARRLGHPAVGFELDPVYAAVASGRLPPVFANPVAVPSGSVPPSHGPRFAGESP